MGGGFSGWLTARALEVNYPDLAITVVDSDKHQRLGVGEKFGYNAPYELRRLMGLTDDRMLMWETGAIYNYGTRWKNFWQDNHDVAYGKFYNLNVKSLTKFYSGFDYVNYVEHWNKKEDDYGLLEAWFKINQNNNKTYYDYINECNEAEWFLKNPLAPYDKNNDYVLRNQEGWGYNIDAEGGVSFLKSLCLQNKNLKYVSCAVAQINYTDQDINSIILENNEEITADLFIDCTGFARVLLEKNSTWIDMGKNFNDSAWVCPTAYIDPASEMNGAANFTGKDWGWTFKLPLYHRIGNGYVFNSNLSDPDQILKEFETIVNETKLAPPRLLQWKPGYYKKVWVGNVLALGVSAWWIDPFDSPAFEIQTRGLNDLIKIWGYNPRDCSEQYNVNNDYVVQERNLRLIASFGLSKRSGYYWDIQRHNYTTNYGNNAFVNFLTGKLDSINQHYRNFIQQIYYRIAAVTDFDRTKIDLPNINKDDSQMATAYFNYMKQRNLYVQKQTWPNYYSWIKENRFDKMDSRSFRNLRHPQWQDRSY